MRRDARLPGQLIARVGFGAQHLERHIICRFHNSLPELLQIGLLITGGRLPNQGENLDENLVRRPEFYKAMIHNGNCEREISGRPFTGNRSKVFLKENSLFGIMIASQLGALIGLQACASTAAIVAAQVHSAYSRLAKFMRIARKHGRQAPRYLSPLLLTIDTSAEWSNRLIPG